MKSVIPAYSKQFIYHIHLENKTFRIDTEPGIEYAAFLPLQSATINGQNFEPGEFIEFDRNGGTIEVEAKDRGGDILVFGGEPYTEPIVAQGPFAMNTQEEIIGAYRDFHAGKYGKIKFSNS